MRSEVEVVIHGVEGSDREHARLDSIVSGSYFGVKLVERSLPEGIDDELVFRTQGYVPNGLYEFLNEFYDVNFNFVPITFEQR